MRWTSSSLERKRPQLTKSGVCASLRRLFAKDYLGRVGAAQQLGFRHPGQ